MIFLFTTSAGVVGVGGQCYYIQNAQCTLFKWRSHDIDLCELNTELTSSWNLDHGIGAHVSQVWHFHQNVTDPVYSSATMLPLFTLRSTSFHSPIYKKRVSSCSAQWALCMIWDLSPKTCNLIFIHGWFKSVRHSNDQWVLGALFWPIAGTWVDNYIFL